MYEKPKMQKNDKIQQIKIHSEKTLPNWDYSILFQ